MLRMNFPQMWFVGFYCVKPDGSGLQIGPYQGMVLACGTIAFGRGVCGVAAATGTTQIVDDVSAIENYIACDDDTKSEIVVPVFQGTGEDRKLFAVLDVDSDKIAAFDAVDKEKLELLCATFF
jgi:L-methionine (R)-S-oxide reductase